MILILFMFVFVFGMMFFVAIVRTFAKGASAIVTVPWGWWMAYITKAAAEAEAKAGTTVPPTEPVNNALTHSSNVVTESEMNAALEQCGGDLKQAVKMLAKQRGLAQLLSNRQLP
jgi:hypothetical protein